MADNILRAIITADGSQFEKAVTGIKTSMQSLSGGIAILQTQLDRLQKLASLPGLNLNQLNRIAGLINTTQLELTKLQSVASRVAPEFGKITNSTNELEKRIRIATSAEHEFNTLLGSTPALLSGVENPAAALGQEFLVLSTGIQRAREAGQSFGQIASTLAASVFSLQGIITLAAAAVFSFSKELFGNEKQLENSTLTLQAYEQKLAELSKVLADLKGQFKFSDDVRKLNEELAKAGIDAGSLKGLNLSQAFDTKDSKEKIKEIDSQVSLIDKDLDKVNEKWNVGNDAIQKIVGNLDKLKKAGVTGIEPTDKLLGFVQGQGTSIKDIEKLIVKFKDVTKIPEEDLKIFNTTQRDLIKGFQETTKKLDELTTNRTELLRQKSALQTTTQTKTIEDQESIDKKQAEIFSKQTELLAQHLDNIKTTIETAKKIQATGDFAIPKALLIPDSVFAQVTEQGQKLIKQRQDLVSQLTRLDILEQTTGKDQTKAKAAVQLEITKIDLKLSDADFKNAAEIIRERLNGLLRVAPVSITANIKLPTAIPETQKAEFQKSIDNLLQKIKSSVPIEITPEFNKDFQDKLKQALSQVDNAHGFDGLLRSMERVGELGKIAGEETKKAFLAAGASIDQADKAAQKAEKEFDKLHGGLSEGLAESAKLLDSVLTPAFQGLFDAILAGEDPLKAFFNSVIQGVEQLISKLIAAAVEAAILSAITGGASSFGSLFAKILGFAEGGTPPVNKVSVVGEKGPELFFPKTSGFILSNQKSKALLSESITQAKENSRAVYEHKITTIINNIDNSVRKWFYGASESNYFTSSTIQKFDKLISSFSYRSTGGPVTFGKPVIVGEHRPELFVPKTDGFIVPYVPTRPFDKNLIEILNINKSISFKAGGGSVASGSQNIVGEFGPEAFFPNISQHNPQSGGIINAQPVPVFIPKLVVEGNNLAIYFNRMQRSFIATTGKKPF